MLVLIVLYDTYHIEDAEKVASILGNRYNAPAQSKKATKEHFVLVGHGTYTPRILATFSASSIE